MRIGAQKKARARQAAREIPAITWEDVLVNLSDAVLLIDTDGRVLSCNPAAEHLLRLPQGQIRDRFYEDVFAGSPEIAALLRRARESKQSQTEGAVSLAHPGGQSSPVRIATSPLLDSQGGIRGTAVVIHNLSYERSLEGEARRAEEIAKLGTVVAGLAHEIKNPLGGIKGAAQLLERQLTENSSVRDYTGLIIREADRLSGLVEQLLGLGALAPPQFARLNIHRLIGDVLLLVSEMPSAAGVTIQCQFDPSLPLVHADERQLKQVLLNLITNAFDAMESSGTLTLTTRMETNFHIVRPRQGNSKLIRVEVSDTGSGMTAEQVSRIFDPFFTTKSRGTGLGLAISHRIASAHGGSLQALSSMGKGTVMTLTLPVATD